MHEGELVSGTRHGGQPGIARARVGSEPSLDPVVDTVAVRIALDRSTHISALIFSGTDLFIAAERHLSQQGIVAPRDVSLVSTDYFPEAFYWCDPPISHIRVNWDSVRRRVLRWVDRVARAQKCHRQTFTKAPFIEGGTIGPVPAWRGGRPG